MKKKPLFTILNNTVFDANDNPISFFTTSASCEELLSNTLFFEQSASKKINLIQLYLSWNNIETEESIYNEAFLASLRESLKKAEEYSMWFFIKPVWDKDSSDSQAFIGAVVHAIRRLKDCKNIIGLDTNTNFSSSLLCIEQALLESIQKELQEQLTKKHSHFFFNLDEIPLTQA